MLLLVDIEGAHMKGTAAARIGGTHFLGDEKIAERPRAGEQLQAAVNGVVVGESDQVHASGQRPLVDLRRIGVAVPCCQGRYRAQTRVPRVDMQVGTNHPILRLSRSYPREPD